jgi:hypothetical protein
VAIDTRIAQFSTVVRKIISPGGLSALARRRNGKKTIFRQFRVSFEQACRKFNGSHSVSADEVSANPMKST